MSFNHVTMYTNTSVNKGEDIKMQRIANLLVVKDEHVLLLKKPRRGWYVAPGGKMDPGESIYEAAVREFTEETGAKPIDPHLKRRLHDGYYR